MKKLCRLTLFIIMGLLLGSCNKYIDSEADINAPTTSFASEQQSIEFDFSSIHNIGTDPLNNPIYFVNQINFNHNNTINYGYTYSNENDDYSNGRIVKTEKVSNDLFKISYYGEHFEYIGTVIIGSNDQLDFSFGGWGNATMDCIENVYSDHGWLSVWATVQTGFLPQTGAAFAIACGISNI